MAAVTTVVRPELAIEVRGLGKRYAIGERERYRALRDVIATAWRRRRIAPEEHIWALRDVSFDIPMGESVGIIGRNGAGKSTLLKLLSRITEPTEGEARVRGRIGSLLEVGSGFHPELTGRENVYLNGAILGMRRDEVRRKFDQIVDFAGVARFIDTPVKRFSSGMYMRLAFSVAAHLETEILMIDEVLAVGDAEFQLKCLTRMSQVANEGRTVLFVSHNLDAVVRLCRGAILLEDGRVTLSGPSQQCVTAYLASASAKTVGGSLRDHPGRTKRFDGPIQLTGVDVAASGDSAAPVRAGGSLEITVDYEVQGPAAHGAAFFAIVSTIGDHRLAALRSQDVVGEPFNIDRPGRVRCVIPRLAVVPGLYKLAVGVVAESGYSDIVYDAATFEIAESDFYPSGAVPPRGWGDLLLDHTWELR